MREREIEIKKERRRGKTQRERRTEEERYTEKGGRKTHIKKEVGHREKEGRWEGRQRERGRDGE